MNIAKPLVLICMDMQKAFDLPGRPRRWNNNLDRNGLILLKSWRGQNLPILHVRNEDPNPRSSFHRNHPGCEFRTGFEPLPEEGLICKSVNSAFIGTDLDLRLRRLNADGIVLFGMRTDMCISSTARSSSNIGWQVTVVADACDCCDLSDPFDTGIIPAEDVHRIHLATIADEFGRVVSTSEAIAQIGVAMPS